MGGNSESKVFIKVGDSRGGELHVGGCRRVGLGFRGDKVSPALAFTAASAEFGVDGVGIATDVDDFLSGEDVDFNRQGRLRAARPGFKDTSGGGAVTGGDVCGDGEGSLRDGLSREEIMLKEQDDSKLGYGFSAGRDVADAYAEDLRGVVLL